MVFDAVAVTGPPLFHFFGYYGIQPWNEEETALLALEVPFQNRPPEAEDEATILLLKDGAPPKPLAKTKAWNLQQGCMMHWLPGSPEEIIYNIRTEDRFASNMLNTETGEGRVLPRPVSAVGHRGRFALSLNFSRLHAWRAGYGYAGPPDPHADEKHPEGDGIFALDLETGEEWLVVSIKEVFDLCSDEPGLQDSLIWFNHTLFNTDDSRFIFLSRFSRGGTRRTAMFTSDLEGDLRCLIDYGLVSHFDWFDPRRILVWANIGGEGDAFYLVDDGTADHRKIGEGILTQDGHCSFSPDRRWILTDTYPGKEGTRDLMAFQWKKERLIPLGRFLSDPSLQGEIRCDLHPRWSRKGDRICFDSTHEGSRQLYVMPVDLGDR